MASNLQNKRQALTERIIELGELAYSPDTSHGNHSQYADNFEKLLEG